MNADGVEVAELVALARALALFAADTTVAAGVAVDKAAVAAADARVDALRGGSTTESTTRSSSLSSSTTVGEALLIIVGATVLTTGCESVLISFFANGALLFGRLLPILLAVFPLRGRSTPIPVLLSRFPDADRVLSAVVAVLAADNGTGASSGGGSDRM